MNSCKNIIGRYAPSPSGILHLGNMTTCLLVWLDSRSAGGSLVFRMEDLDPERSSDIFASQIAEDLMRLGLDWDRGYPQPEYSQGNRTALYEDVFGILMRRDMLYPCYCSRSERLAASAPHPGEEHRDPGCKCRYLSRLEREALEAKGRKPAWKVKVPDKLISFTDGHYGTFEENLADSGDFIIKRSDGVFAYQLAVVADDIDAGVTQVVRGRDLLSSTPRQLYLYRLLGAAPPEYYHVPLLTAPDGRRLSKRDRDLDLGILRKAYTAPELLGALAHAAGLLDKREPISAEELIPLFDWAKIPKDDIAIDV